MDSRPRVTCHLLRLYASDTPAAITVPITGASLDCIGVWRRERDSNLRGLAGPCGFQERHVAFSLVPLDAELNTNHDKTVVTECLPVPARAVAVGVLMGVGAGAERRTDQGRAPS